MLATILLLVFAWNFWLPTARQLFHQPSGKAALPNVDFLAYVVAGERFDRGENPYLWPAAGDSPETLSDFLYPPTLLPLYARLAQLPYDAARSLWLTAYAALHLATLAALAWRLRPDQRQLYIGLALSFSLMSFPLLFHIQLGQVDVIVICLALAAYLTWARGRMWPSATCLALATLVKVSPAALLITFVAYRRDLRYLAAYGICLAALVALSLFWVEASLYRVYALEVLPAIAPGSGFWPNQSLLRFADRLPVGGPTLTALGGAALTAFTCWISASAGRRHTDDDGWLKHGEAEALFFLNLLAVLLLAGFAWSTAYVWAILPGALALTVMAGAGAGRIPIGLVALGMALMLAKVYGLPGLQTLNLTGNLLASAGLVLWLVQRRRLAAGPAESAAQSASSPAWRAPGPRWAAVRLPHHLPLPRPGSTTETTRRSRGPAEFARECAREVRRGVRWPAEASQPDLRSTSAWPARPKRSWTRTATRRSRSDAPSRLSSRGSVCARHGRTAWARLRKHLPSNSQSASHRSTSAGKSRGPGPSRPARWSTGPPSARSRRRRGCRTPANSCPC